MSRDEALTLALEALEWNMAYLPTSHDDDGTTMAIEAVTAIKEALAPMSTTCEVQPEQEPFTYYNPVRDAIRPFKSDGDIPLYTTPPKPAWVGLMVAEMEELTLIAGRMGYTRMLQLAEAKLKEKNT